jgi:ubiquinone/menaquinone biosynthesis C-methylase UbiE
MKLMIDRSLNYGRHILQSFLSQELLLKTGICLDLGAGRGEDLILVKKNMPNAQLHAIECYESNIEYLKKNGIMSNALNLERDCFPFSEEYFDLIIANQVLEHCKEIFWIFHEISRTLKIGGYIYIGVPNLAALHCRLLLLFGRQPSCVKTASAHIRGFTKPDILDFINACAPNLYSVKIFRGSNFYPFPSFLAKILSKAFPSSSTCIFLVLKKNKQYNSEFLKYPVGLETNFWRGSQILE